MLWYDNATTESGFAIERSTQSTTQGFTEIFRTAANVTYFPDRNLIEGTTYYYRIRAFNYWGYSSYSAFSPVTYLKPPFIFSAVQSGALQVTVSWQDLSSCENGFKIERSLSYSTGYVQVGTVGANTSSYVDMTGLAIGKTYYYQVSAYVSQGSSAPSSIASVIVQPILPDLEITVSGYSPVVFKRGDIVSCTYTVRNRGTAVAGACQAGLYIDSVLQNSAQTPLQNISSLAAGASTSPITMTWIAAEGYHRIRVGVDINNQVTEIIESNNQSNEATFTTLPSAPTNLVATAISDTAVQLTWTDNSYETQFLVERSLNATSGFAVVPGGSTGRDINLQANTRYYYRVYAVNPSGRSDYSNVATTITTVPPAAPTALDSASPSPTKINLAWTDNATNEQGYRIERSSAMTTGFSVLASVGPNVTRYSDTSVSVESVYYYRVKAYNANGDSAYSNTRCHVTPPAPPAQKFFKFSVSRVVVDTNRDGSLRCNDNGVLNIGERAGLRIGIRAIGCDQSIQYSSAWTFTSARLRLLSPVSSKVRVITDTSTLQAVQEIITDVSHPMTVCYGTYMLEADPDIIGDRYEVGLALDISGTYRGTDNVTRVFQQTERFSLTAAKPFYGAAPSPVTLVTGVDLPSIASDENGNVYTAWHNYESQNGGDTVYCSRTNDYGISEQTAGRGVKVSSLFDPNVATTIEIPPKVATDGKGNVYIAWVARRYNGTTESQGLYMARSADWGVSWDREVLLNDGNTMPIVDYPRQAIGELELSCTERGYAFCAWSLYTKAQAWDQYPIKSELYVAVYPNSGFGEAFLAYSRTGGYSFFGLRLFSYIDPLTRNAQMPLIHINLFCRGNVTSPNDLRMNLYSIHCRLNAPSQQTFVAGPAVVAGTAAHVAYWDGPLCPDIVSDNAGAFYACWRDGSYSDLAKTRIYSSFSKNNGDTWSAAAAVDNHWVPASIYSSGQPQTQIIASPGNPRISCSAGGHVQIGWTTSFFYDDTNRTPIRHWLERPIQNTLQYAYFTKSDDYGVSWLAQSRRINDTDNMWSWPEETAGGVNSSVWQMGANADGRIYNLISTVGGLSCEYSDDFGALWNPRVPLTESIPGGSLMYDGKGNLYAAYHSGSATNIRSIRIPKSVPGLPAYYLTTITQNGWISANPNKASYLFGDAVVLTASTSNIRWSGDVPPEKAAAYPLSLTMNKHMIVTANITDQNSYAVHIESNDPGAGSFTYSGSLPGDSIPSNPLSILDQAFSANERITVTALPAAGYRFLRWGGSIAQSDNPISFILDRNVSLTAIFTAENMSTPSVAPIVINNYEPSTSSAIVTLSLCAPNVEIGKGRMQFSNDAVTWSVAETYAATKSWTLSNGTGTKTVYVRFKANTDTMWSVTYQSTVVRI
ncbi:MAG: CARDB domain-containing protein [Candidatus Omnitrophota bacterium]